MSWQSKYVRMFDRVSLKFMLTMTRHTDYIAKENMALHFKKVADNWATCYVPAAIALQLPHRVHTAGAQMVLVPSLPTWPVTTHHPESPG